MGIGGPDVHNKQYLCQAMGNRGNRCPQQLYRRQVLGTGGDAMSTTTVLPPGDGNRGGLDVHKEHYRRWAMGTGGLDVHNKQHCRRAMGIQGLDVHNDSIGTGQFEWGDLMSTTKFIAAG